MKIRQTLDCTVIDGHIHYPHPSMMPGLIKICDQLKIDRLNIVCTPDRHCLSLVPDALHLKANYPKRVFVFGGLDVSAYFRAPNEVGTIFAENVEQLLTVGCDGIKMVDGKPTMRKDLPIPPFDSDVFAPYWEKLEQTQTPLVFHVNDPEEFWDAERAPEWAFERGWFYGDGSFINNEAQYTEIINVLTRHPNLKIIFAHFFFLSAQLPRLASYLDQFTNMHIDLTPGIEMYHNFAKDIDATRDFFLKYQGRIIFGTDIGARALLVDPEEGIQADESRARVFVIRNFLENDREFYLDSDSGFLFGPAGVSFQGIDLPRPVLEKIYYRNFEHAVTSLPRPLNPSAIIDMCSQIEMMLQFLEISQPDRLYDYSVVQAVKSFFESI
ncbi:MAG: amidohydrolase family protein [Chloroflexota bacterium]